METLRFLTPEQAEEIRRQTGTPVFVYDEATLRRNAKACLEFPNAYGLTVRYAMKACSNAALLQIFCQCGLHIDASSGHEVERAMLAGIPPERISLSSQEFPENFAELHRKGISINACSLSQIRRFGEARPGERLGLRFNPGLGSGGTTKTNVGGPASSFGIWHETLDEVRRLISDYDLRVFRIHTHIGSGSDPGVWQRASRLSLDLVRKFPEATHLNLGGGYKVGRMHEESTTDLQQVGAPVRAALEELAAETGRKIHLEIEPGTWLVANAATLLTTVQDMTSTGPGGYDFLKLDGGMTEILRPALYGAQHPLIILPRTDTGKMHPYVAVGHCCESGDLLTPDSGQADELAPRTMAEAAIGDLCAIEGVGAYCASMPAKNYNSFPEAPEVLLRENGNSVVIRRRQTLEQILANEIRGDL